MKSRCLITAWPPPPPPPSIPLRNGVEVEGVVAEEWTRRQMLDGNHWPAGLEIGAAV